MSHVALIVCGSRHWDSPMLSDALDNFLSHWRYATVITGGAPGADAMARAWASNRELTRTIEVPAFWEHTGKSAGHKRNKEMLSLLLAVEADTHMVIGFKNAFDVDMKSGGTENMIGRAVFAGVPACVMGTEGLIAQWNLTR